MTVYSHSRLSTFEQCKLKFKFRYIDKIIPEVEESIESYLGKTVHKALEWLYIKIKENKFKTPSVDELLAYYTKEWESNYPEEIIIVNQKGRIEDYYNKGIQFILNYYIKHKPFDDNTLAVEKRIFVSLDGNGGYKIQGFIDRLSYNLKTGEYEIHDYKTSNNLPFKEKIEADRQLALYSIAIKENYNTNGKICLVWHYLAHDKKICLRKTEEELEKLKKDTIELINLIESTQEFTPNKTRLCGWCEYKSICPAWTGKPYSIEKQKKLENYTILEKDADKKVEELDIFS